MVVAEQISDLLQICSAGVEASGKRMAQSMRACPSRWHTSAPESTSHGLAKTRERKRQSGETAVTEKEMVASLRCRSGTLHVPTKRDGDVGRQRQAPGTIGLGRWHDQGRWIPSDIRQSQLRHFLRSQSEIEQTQRNRVITLTSRIRPSKRGEKPMTLLFGQYLDRSAAAEVGDVRHRLRELRPAGSLQMHKPEKTSQGAKHHVRRTRANMPAKPLGETPDVDRANLCPPDLSGAKLSTQETTGIPTPVDARVRGETTIFDQKPIVAIDPTLPLCWCGRPR